MTTTSTTTPVYTVAKYKALETHNGVAYTADIVKDGRKVGSVEQEGRGGCNRYWFDDAAERVAFVEFARTQSVHDFEPEDVFMERLISVLEFGRMRRIPFVFAADGDPFETGSVRQGPSGMTFAQLKAGLAAQHADKQPRLFDRSVGDFVPVV